MLEMLSSMLSRQYLGLKTIKIKTVNHILCFYNRSFPRNLNHWLLEKNEMINLQMLIKKKYIQCFKFMLSFKKRAQLSNVCICFFGAGSSPVKMSQAFHNLLICFNFSYFHRMVNTFKTPEMCLCLDSDV